MALDWDAVTVTEADRRKGLSFAKATSPEERIKAAKILAEEMLPKAEGSMDRVAQIKSETVVAGVSEIMPTLKYGLSERMSLIRFIKGDTRYSYTITQNGKEIVYLTQEGKRSLGALNLLLNNSNDDRFDEVITFIHDKFADRIAGFNLNAYAGVGDEFARAVKTAFVLLDDNGLIRPGENIVQKLEYLRDVMATTAEISGSFKLAFDDIRSVITKSNDYEMDMALHELLADKYFLGHDVVRLAMWRVYNQVSNSSQWALRTDRSEKYIQRARMAAALVNDKAVENMKGLLLLQRANYKDDDLKKTREALDGSIRRGDLFEAMHSQKILEAIHQNGSEAFDKISQFILGEKFEKLSFKEMETLKELVEAFRLDTSDLGNQAKLYRAMQEFNKAIQAHFLEKRQEIQTDIQNAIGAITETKAKQGGADIIAKKNEEIAARKADIRTLQEGLDQLTLRAQFLTDLASSRFFVITESLNKTDLDKDTTKQLHEKQAEALSQAILRTPAIFQDEKLTKSLTTLAGLLLHHSVFDAQTLANTKKDYQMAVSNASARIWNDGKQQSDFVERQMTTAGIIESTNLLLHRTDAVIQQGPEAEAESPENSAGLRKLRLLTSSILRLEELSVPALMSIKAILKTPNISAALKNAAETLYGELSAEKRDAAKVTQALVAFKVAAEKDERFKNNPIQVNQISQTVEQLSDSFELTNKLLNEMEGLDGIKVKVMKAAEPGQEKETPVEVRADELKKLFEQWLTKKTDHAEVVALMNQMNKAEGFDGVLRFDTQLNPETDPNKPQFYAFNIKLIIDTVEKSTTTVAARGGRPTDSKEIATVQIDGYRSLHPDFYQQYGNLIIKNKSALGQFVERNLLIQVQGQKASKTGAIEKIFEAIGEEFRNSDGRYKTVKEIINEFIDPIWLSHEGEHANQRTDPRFEELTRGVRNYYATTSMTYGRKDDRDAQAISSIAERFLIEITAHLRSMFEKYDGTSVKPIAALFVLYQLYTYLSAPEDQHYKEVAKYIYEDLVRVNNEDLKKAGQTKGLLEGRLFADYTPEDVILAVMRRKDAAQFTQNVAKKLFERIYDKEEHFEREAIRVATEYQAGVKGDQFNLRNTYTIAKLTDEEKRQVAAKAKEYGDIWKEEVARIDEEIDKQNGSRLGSFIDGIKQRDNDGGQRYDQDIERAMHRLAVSAYRQNWTDDEIRKRINRYLTIFAQALPNVIMPGSEDYDKYVRPYESLIQRNDVVGQIEYDRIVKKAGEEPLPQGRGSIVGRVFMMDIKKMQEIEEFGSALGWFNDALGISLIGIDTQFEAKLDQKMGMMRQAMQAQSMPDKEIAASLEKMRKDARSHYRGEIWKTVDHERRHQQQNGFLDEYLDEGSNELTRREAGRSKEERLMRAVDVGAEDEETRKYGIYMEAQKAVEALFYDGRTVDDILLARYFGDVGIFAGHSVDGLPVGDIYSITRARKQLESMRKRETLKGNFDPSDQYEYRAGSAETEAVAYGDLDKQLNDLATEYPNLRVQLQVLPARNREDKNEKTKVVITPVNGRPEFNAKFPQADKPLAPEVQAFEIRARGLKSRAELLTRHEKSIDPAEAAELQQDFEKLANEIIAEFAKGKIDNRSKSFVAAIRWLMTVARTLAFNTQNLIPGSPESDRREKQWQKYQQRFNLDEKAMESLRQNYRNTPDYRNSPAVAAQRRREFGANVRTLVTPVTKILKLLGRSDRYLEIKTFEDEMVNRDIRYHFSGMQPSKDQEEQIKLFTKESQKKAYRFFNKLYTLTNPSVEAQGQGSPAEHIMNEGYLGPEEDMKVFNDERTVENNLKHRLFLLFKKGEISDETFKRLYLFIESKDYKGRTADEKAAKNYAVQIAGHDYKDEDIVSFLNAYLNAGIDLIDAEKALVKTLIEEGLIKEIKNDTGKLIGYEAVKNFAVLSASIDDLWRKGEQYLRDTINHEFLGHGLYFTSEEFRIGLEKIWDSLTPEQREGVKQLLQELQYDVAMDAKDPKDKPRYELLLTELHAYARDRGAFMTDIRRIDTNTKNIIFAKLGKDFLETLEKNLKKLEKDTLKNEGSQAYNFVSIRPVQLSEAAKTFQTTPAAPTDAQGSRLAVPHKSENPLREFSNDDKANRLSTVLENDQTVKVAGGAPPPVKNKVSGRRPLVGTVGVTMPPQPPGADDKEKAARLTTQTSFIENVLPVAKASPTPIQTLVNEAMMLGPVNPINIGARLAAGFGRRSFAGNFGLALPINQSAQLPALFAQLGIHPDEARQIQAEFVKGMSAEENFFIAGMKRYLSSMPGDNHDVYLLEFDRVATPEGKIKPEFERVFRELKGYMNNRLVIYVPQARLAANPEVEMSLKKLNDYNVLTIQAGTYGEILTEVQRIAPAARNISITLGGEATNTQLLKDGLTAQSPILKTVFGVVYKNAPAGIGEIYAAVGLRALSPEKVKVTFINYTKDEAKKAAEDLGLKKDEFNWIQRMWKYLTDMWTSFHTSAIAA